MMKDNFWGFIWQSFLEIQGLWIGFLGIVITLILARFPFKTPIPLDLVIIIAFFTLLFLFTLLQTVNKLLIKKRQLESELEREKETNQSLVNELNKLKNPRVLRVQKQRDADFIICLLERSELFAFETPLSLYYIDEDGFERFIGGGIIQQIQTDGKMQALIDQPFTAYQNILDKLMTNDSQVLEKIEVKLGIPRSFRQP